MLRTRPTSPATHRYLRERRVPTGAHRPLSRMSRPVTCGGWVNCVHVTATLIYGREYFARRAGLAESKVATIVAGEGPAGLTRQQDVAARHARPRGPGGRGRRRRAGPGMSTEGWPTDRSRAEARGWPVIVTGATHPTRAQVWCLDRSQVSRACRGLPPYPRGHIGSTSHRR